MADPNVWPSHQGMGCACADVSLSRFLLPVPQANTANIKMLIPDFFNENLVRGRGLFARALITAQQSSPTFTPVYAALLAVINTKVIWSRFFFSSAWSEIFVELRGIACWSLDGV